ncbi:Uncharacterised protein [Vibrio cholerae]|nr:Uncharacterised protein [Vibrio cholerae]
MTAVKSTTGLVNFLHVFDEIFQDGDFLLHCADDADFHRGSLSSINRKTGRSVA